ncbi:hypothetical protein Mapa_005957 [Marchantia paleacea]|nr:hypothetical protein Mapa_005957 [Marchantia paleacea]
MGRRCIIHLNLSAQERKAAKGSAGFQNFLFTDKTEVLECKSHKIDSATSCFMYMDAEEGRKRKPIAYNMYQRTHRDQVTTEQCQTSVRISAHRASSSPGSGEALHDRVNLWRSWAGEWVISTTSLSAHQTLRLPSGSSRQ